MKKVLMTLIAALVICGSSFAYQTHWPEFNLYQYQFNLPLVAFVQVNGEYVTVENYTNFEIGAFVDDECRGHMFMDDYTDDGDPYPIVEINYYYTNTDTDENKTVTFQLFDHTTGQLYEIGTTNMEVITGDDHVELYFDYDDALVMSFGEAASVQTFTKEIAGYGTGTDNWYLIASPLAEAVAPTDVEYLINENGYDLYRFNQSAEEEWEHYKGHQNDFMLEPGQGYLYANSEDVELVFTGIPYNSNCEVVLAYDENASDDMRGWNLVGNPFNEPCYIEGDVEGNRDFYVMNEEDGDLYVGRNYLNPMEGGFVYAEWDFDVITLTNTNPAGAKSANVSLNLSNGNAVIDRAIVRFGEGRQLPKFQLRSSSTKLAIAQNDSEYAVVRSGNEGEMPVNFKAEKSGTYTISVNSENVEFGYLHLFDNMTGNDIDLLADPSYTFEAKTTDYASRFRLVFSAETETESFAYFNGSEWVVNGTGTMQMVDMTGRVLSSENVTGIATVNTNKLSAGVYVMRLVNGNDVKTQKIVVR